MKTIAICVRGSIRTWDLCKHNLFNVLDFGRFKDVKVDWFFDVWDNDSFTVKHFDSQFNLIDQQLVKNVITPDTVQKIKDDFTLVGRHLVSFNIHAFDHDMNPSLSFLKLVYLSNLSKRSFELKSNFKYDVCVQIRPDIFISPNSIKHCKFIESIIESANRDIINFSIPYDSGDNIDSFNDYPQYANLTEVSNIPAPQDLLFYGNSLVMDHLSNAYHFLIDDDVRRYPFPHASLFIFLNRYGFKIGKNTPVIQIVRIMKIDGVYDYYDLVNKKIIDSDEFINAISLATNLWYKS